MRHIPTAVTVLLFVAGSDQAYAQALPTSQPNLIQIIREEVKIGHEADHAKTEAGWPAAFEKAKNQEFYFGLASVTGPSEAWFIIPYDSNRAMGDSMKKQSDDAVLSAELARLSRADSAHVNSYRSILAMARKDLSRGAFPDLGKQRFLEVTIFRVRPGHENTFTEGGKAYGAAAGRAAPAVAYRVYEVVAGMPGPTYIVISSVPSFGDFDKMTTDGEAVMKAASPQEMAALQKFAQEALINSETQRFRVDPEMSYVPAEVRAQDPGFWMPKKPAVKKVSDH